MCGGSLLIPAISGDEMSISRRAMLVSCTHPKNLSRFAGEVKTRSGEGEGAASAPCLASTPARRTDVPTQSPSPAPQQRLDLSRNARQAFRKSLRRLHHLRRIGPDAAGLTRRRRGQTEIVM